MQNQFKNILVIGSGVMGQGIAQFFCQKAKTCGMEKVFLTDAQEGNLKLGVEKIHSSWKHLTSKNKFTPQEYEEFVSTLSPCSLEEGSIDFESIDLVIEAIVENLEEKKILFQKVMNLLPPQCVVATNTSSLSVNKIAQGLDEWRRAYFLGLHFFNPAPIIPLVEIVKTPDTLESVILECSDFLKDCGKKIVLVEDSPGFLVNRMARNFYNESLHILPMPNGGVKHEEYCREIDSILKEVGGFAMGPFELMDMIGLDINYKATFQVWEEFYYHPRFSPHLLQKKLVEMNHLGRKTKKGFYDYN